MARGRSSFSKSGRGTAGPKTVKLRTTTGKALPASNGGTGRPSTSMSPWKGGGKTRTGV